MVTQQIDTGIFDECIEVFKAKNKAYGISWKHMRFTTLIELMHIKLRRIANIEEIKVSKVEDSIIDDLKGIINYSVISLIHLDYLYNNLEYSEQTITEYYEFHIKEIIDLMQCKNHDYGDAWKYIRITAMTDMMLTKIYRIHQLCEDMNDQSMKSIRDNLYDIVNYCLFYIIREKTD